MKVLVATARTQGDRPGDFRWCIEGELVRVGDVCAIDGVDPDGGCGCGRAFAGLSSRKSTTARIAEVPLSRADYAEVIRSSLQQRRWEPDAVDAEDEADELAEIIAHLPVGTVVERRLDELVVRCLADTA